MMNKYQEALERLSSIDLDLVLEELGYEKAGKISDYGMNDYPNLEMYGDIETLKELVDKATPKKPIGKYVTQLKCPVCGRRVRSGNGSSSRTRDNVCQRCFQVLDWSERRC